MGTGIMWFRRDLRVHDHPALHAARTKHDAIACVFVVEPSMLRASPARAAFLVRALGSLTDELERRGAQLIVTMGPAHEAIPRLARVLDAEAVHATQDVTPRASRRDDAVAGNLSVPLHLHPGLAIHEAGSIANRSGTPYKIFTPYFHRWRAREPRALAPTPRKLRGIEHGVYPAAVDALAAAAGPVSNAFPSSEQAALDALSRFVRHRLEGYDEERHRLDGAGGSMLSPAMRFGLLSPITAMAAADGHEHAAGWVRQIAWRDFAYATVVAAPRSLARSLRAPRERWRSPGRTAVQWREADTGEPVVDAAMRELATWGWISGRARMLVGSWLVRDNHIDWRVGARHFMRTLLDGDPAVNAFNWQWIAGTGWDVPAPFWRLAPTTQARRHDPEGAWVQRWATA